MSCKYPDIEVELTTRDSTKMIAIVCSALDKNGIPMEEVEECRVEAFLAGNDEDELIDVIKKWVSIK